MEINNSLSSTYNEQFYKVIVKCYTMWFVNTAIFTKYKNPSSSIIINGLFLTLYLRIDTTFGII
jgi:hypothetical protein